MTELPIIDELPVLSPTGGGCGSSGGGCGSSGGGCGSSGCGSIGTSLESDEPIVEVPFNKRRLALSAAPTEGSFVRNLDLDLTVECNLRCVYCFKEKWNEHMEERVAFDTMIWFLHASGPATDLRVNFMGGEPMLRFKMIQRLVPFAKRRAWQMGKNIHFGITTNGTLITDAVVKFWKKWGMGFHTSIDGTPEIQNRNRPTTGGRGSAHLVEKAVPKILDYRPETCARATVTPESVHSLVDSYRYFRKLGYTDIALVPGCPTSWDEESITVFEQQYTEAMELAAEEIRKGVFIDFKGLGEYAEAQQNGRSPVTCGAGRGLLLVDIHGDIWPCHRWNKQTQASWRIGSIYEQFNDANRAILDVPDQTVHLEQDCPSCIANQVCSGGCPAENLEETGSVYRRSINACELTRAVVRTAKKVHDQLVAEENETFLKIFYSESG